MMKILNKIKRTITLDQNKLSGTLCEITGCTEMLQESGPVGRRGTIQTLSTSRSGGVRGSTCKVSYCDCIHLGCNRRICNEHKTTKWVMETKHKRKGLVKPTVCTECGTKVQIVSLLICILIPALVIILVVLLITWMHIMRNTT